MKINVLSLLLIFSFCLSAQQYDGFSFNPEQYVARQSITPLEVDGKLDEESWQLAKWSNDFVDIEGEHAISQPYRRTRVKMLWDANYFYVGAEMMETHIWATYRERDTVIFDENDFEVFIDPEGDSHHYYELEINALGTIWDLMLSKPYRDGGIALDAWDIRGLKSAVHIDGTLNNPSDTDHKWSVELAFPWKVLEEAAKTTGTPREGEQWRINFSRVHWKIHEVNGVYQKDINPNTGKHFSPYNWVWSAQGKIAMHQPETWGYVQFSKATVGQGNILFEENPLESIKWSLYNLYYAQLEHLKIKGTYQPAIEKLKLKRNHLNELTPYVSITVSPISFDAIYYKREILLSIDQEGKLQNLSKP